MGVRGARRWRTELRGGEPCRPLGPQRFKSAGVNKVMGGQRPSDVEETIQEASSGECHEDPLGTDHQWLFDCAAGFSDSALNGVVNVPMPSISIVTTSPGLRNFWRSAPVPAGVPVEITSPG